MGWVGSAKGGMESERLRTTGVDESRFNVKNKIC